MNTFILFTLTLILSVFSQTIQIADPADGASVQSGQNMNVMLEFPNSLTGMTHVSVVISLLDCPDLNKGQCVQQNATDSLGKTLFAGNYTPQFHEQDRPPYQNFTVAIPQGQQPPNLLLTVAHFMLVGASASPILEFKNVSLVGTAASAKFRL
ncbi:hypothetical protein V5O48_002866 [Marasmius crinis-equi]|uniref:Uncharacterized protein n=1 Tax=Marasmius crinis-equi TaxID=585013 RepID=A0ABR3FUF4_9AGAR